MLLCFTLCVIKKLFVPICHVIVITNEIIWLIHMHQNVSTSKLVTLANNDWHPFLFLCFGAL